MSRWFATPLSPLAMGCLHRALSILELTGEPLQLWTGLRPWLLLKLSPWWSHQAKVKDADKVHLLKITELSNLCHQRKVRCEKSSWDTCRGSKLPHELSQVALFKKGAWRLRLEEGSVNLGGGCQCMDRLWVKWAAPPRKNRLLYSGRNRGGQRSFGRGREGKSCSLWSAPGKGAREHLVTIYHFPALFCPLLHLAVSSDGVNQFSKMAFLLHHIVYSGCRRRWPTDYPDGPKEQKVKFQAIAVT